MHLGEFQEAESNLVEVRRLVAAVSWNGRRRLVVESYQIVWRNGWLFRSGRTEVVRGVGATLE